MLRMIFGNLATKMPYGRKEKAPVWGLGKFTVVFQKEGLSCKLPCHFAVLDRQSLPFDSKDARSRRA